MAQQELGHRCDWHGVLLIHTLTLPMMDALAWVQSDTVDGRFTVWPTLDRGYDFRFSDLGAATHFRLMFGGKVLDG